MPATVSSVLPLGASMLCIFPSTGYNSRDSPREVWVVTLSTEASLETCQHHKEKTLRILPMRVVTFVRVRDVVNTI